MTKTCTLRKETRGEEEASESVESGIEEGRPRMKGRRAEGPKAWIFSEGESTCALLWAGCDGDT